ncbi:MAG: DUF882 domain-containing protein [Cardiobacteriaceae bacterium]|nr:DUF882 domain-containing protein [Cardiobacteriaceae bacterium]
MAAYEQEQVEHDASCPCCSGRRQLLSRLAFGTMGLLLPAQWAVASGRSERKIRFRNINTGESMTGIYWTPETGYIQPSIEQISYFFRDFREDSVHSVDVNLLNILSYIQHHVGGRELILRSGYRSPKTNEGLRRSGSKNVAKNSYHMVAKAADIGVQGYSGKQLATIARGLNAGGVGVGNSFIHVDSGDKDRVWRY